MQGTRIRRCIPTEDYIIAPYAWQAYGIYTETDEPNAWFASPVRASNEMIARDAVLRSVHPLGPVITSLKPIEPMPRPENDRRRFRRDNPHLCA